MDWWFVAALAVFIPLALLAILAAFYGGVMIGLAAGQFIEGD
jgi:hypothetical protein